LTTAIEADLAKIDSGTACEQEKISIFESEVELGGPAQKILLPKNSLIQKYKNFTPLIRTKACKKAVKACPIHAQKYKEINRPANSEIGIKVPVSPDHRSLKIEIFQQRVRWPDTDLMKKSPTQSTHAVVHTDIKTFDGGWTAHGSESCVAAHTKKNFLTSTINECKPTFSYFNQNFIFNRLTH